MNMVCLACFGFQWISILQKKLMHMFLQLSQSKYFAISREQTLVAWKFILSHRKSCKLYYAPVITNFKIALCTFCQQSLVIPILQKELMQILLQLCQSKYFAISCEQTWVAWKFILSPRKSCKLYYAPVITNFKIGSWIYALCTFCQQYLGIRCEKLRSAKVFPFRISNI